MTCPTMTPEGFKVFTFHDRTGTAPTWVASVMAIMDSADDTLMDHAVVLVAAHTEADANEKALNLALRNWKLADGWGQHSAVACNLETALKRWHEDP